MQLDLPVTMQAWRRDSHGELVLAETVTPHPNNGEVLVKISAAGINPVDYKTSWAGIKISTGVDGAGTIAMLGQGTEGMFTVGDRVMFHASLLAMRSARPEVGSFAEFAVVPVEALVPILDGVSDLVAAALPCPAGTAQQVADCLRATIQESAVENPAIFVQGASGSVARFVVQLLAQDFPALHIIGSSSASGHADLARFGVTAVDYRDSNGNSGPEVELSEVTKALDKQKKSLIGIVNFQGGASANLHFSILGRGAMLVCVLDGPSIKELPDEAHPDVGMIALGQAYDVAAGAVEPKDAVEAYRRINPQGAVSEMAGSYRRISSRLSTSGKGSIEPPSGIRAISFGEIAANLNVSGKTVALLNE